MLRTATLTCAVLLCTAVWLCTAEEGVVVLSGSTGTVRFDNVTLSQTGTGEITLNGDLQVDGVLTVGTLVTPYTPTLKTVMHAYSEALALLLTNSKLSLGSPSIFGSSGTITADAVSNTFTLAGNHHVYRIEATFRLKMITYDAYAMLDIWDEDGSAFMGVNQNQFRPLRNQDTDNKWTPQNAIKGVLAPSVTTTYSVRVYAFFGSVFQDGIGHFVVEEVF